MLIFGKQWKFAAAIALTAALACGSPMPSGKQTRAEDTDAGLAHVLEAHKPRLLRMEGVVGVGRGRCDGAPCVKVMVREKTPELANSIGTRIEGYPVEIIETGDIRPLQGR